jgi:hypothetical protein
MKFKDFKEQINAIVNCDDYDVRNGEERLITKIEVVDALEEISIS